MKIAIGLYGSFSPYYMENKEYQNSDLFMVLYEPHPDTSKAKDSTIINTIPGVSEVHERLKNSFINFFMIDTCKKLISEYEERHGFKYDIYLFATFSTVIVLFPSRPGSYSYGCFHPQEQFSCFEIVSDRCVKFGIEPEHFFDLSLEKRKIVLDRLYNKKVCDFQFLENDSANIIFLIPSVIHVSSEPFNYYTFGHRSIFTPHERFKQTLQQVQSLQRLENYKSYLLEGSDLTFSEMKKLSEYTQVVLFTKDKQGNFHANQNQNKSMYELYVIRQMLDKISFQWVFKFGGRYHLTEHFNIHKFLQNKPAFKVIAGKYTYTRRPIAECIIYSFPNHLKEKYKRVYDIMMERVENEPQACIEDMFYTYARDFHLLETCDVLGKDGVYGWDKVI